MRLLVFLFISFICKRGSATTYGCNTAASCGCSSSSTVLSRIVGGEPAAHQSWSWTISLRAYGGHICGGSILSPYFVVTAAHCIDDVTDLSTMTILAGSVNLVPSSSDKVHQVRSIAHIYKHPNYNADEQTDDIALLRLSSPLNMTMGNLKPICLPTGSTVEPPNNINMIAVGWGVTSESSDQVSPILRQVTVKSIASTTSSCQSAIYDSQLQFCAGLESGGKDTCQGDSGGPLMAYVNGHWQLDGLTSYGYGCAEARNPGVYTRVSSYIKWINSTIQSNGIKTTTQTNRKTTPSRKSLLDPMSETPSNNTYSSTAASSLSESTLQTSNGADHATIQSWFLMLFLPIVISGYSILLLFLL